MKLFKPAVIVSYYGGADTIESLRQRGFDAVRIQLRGEAKSNQFLMNYLKMKESLVSEVLVEESFPTVDDLCQELKKIGVTHILPADEAGVSLGDLLCSQLELPFNGLSGSKARRNKALMHQKIEAQGLRIPFQTTVSSVDEVETWMVSKELDYPIVIKPLDGAGSAGVNKCHCKEDVKRAFDYIIGLVEQKKTVARINQKVIAQEFLTGVEYVVDTVSLNGYHKLTDIWRCQKGAHNGAPFVYEYFDLIENDGEIQDSLFNYTSQVLDALEIRIGPGHSEVYLDHAGNPVIVEVGSRLGGPKMPFGTAPCVASGKSQMDYSIDAYMEPHLFHDRWKNRYEKTKHSRMVFLIHHEKRLFNGFNQDTIQTIRSLPSFVHEEWVNAEWLQKTIDVRSSPGFLYLMHDDFSQIESDYQEIRRLESVLFKSS